MVQTIQDVNTSGTNSRRSVMSGGQEVTFGLDALDIRSSKKLADTTQKYLTYGSNPLVYQSGSGATSATVATSGLDESGPRPWPLDRSG